MKLTLSIDMDNAAFQGNAGPEVARILRDLAGYIDETRHPLTFARGMDGKSLRDVNGNRVGVVQVDYRDVLQPAAPARGEGGGA